MQFIDRRPSNFWTLDDYPVHRFAYQLDTRNWPHRPFYPVDKAFAATGAGDEKLNNTEAGRHVRQ